MITPLRLAVIHSDFRARVLVLPVGHAAPPDLHWSHGACAAGWDEASAEALLYELLQIYARLTREGGIEAGRLHRAFRSIPEYRATLDPGHADAMGAAELARLAPMLDLPRGFGPRLSA